MTTIQRSGPRRPRLSYYLLSSLALHAAVVGLVSLRSCRGDPSPVIPAPGGTLVTVEVASFTPLPQPKTARPGGGAPALRINDSAIVPRAFTRHLANREAEMAEPKLVPPPAEEPG